MATHVQVELSGGPQDGRVIMIPAASGGLPLPVPVPSGGLGVAGEIEAPEQADELEIAWYETSYRRCQDKQVYRYTNSCLVQPEWPEDYSSSTQHSSGE